MSYLIAALLLLLLAGVTFALIYKNKPRVDKALSYQKIRTLLSPAERSLLGVLEKSLGGDYRVFSKVRLAEVVKVKDGLSRAARQRAFKAISDGHVDFVICRAGDMSIRGVVAVDDNPQGTPRDPVVDEVLEVCQIPLLRVKARTGYSISEITDRLKSCGIIKVESRQGLLRGDKNGVENRREPISPKLASGDATQIIELETIAVCPRCGSGLVKKVATKGRYAGQEYFGCSNFPNCRYAERITNR